MTRLDVPDLGVGVGLRIPHYDAIFGGGEALAQVDWFEIISENFMVPGGPPMANLARAMELRPVVPHGVSLSIGGTDPLDRAYLTALKQLLARVRPPWVSDHLCWSGAGGHHLHDLFPLPYTDEAVRHVARRVREVADFLEIPFALENVSSYLTFVESAMTEWEFVSRVAEEADCGLLFDVNNVFVSAKNHGFDPVAYVEGIPHERVVQIHLAGHEDQGRYILDTHGGHVIDPVWALYRRACELCGDVSTLIEWDSHIPPFSVVAAEAQKARVIRGEVARQRAARATPAATAAETEARP